MAPAPRRFLRQLEVERAALAAALEGVPEAARARCAAALLHRLMLPFF